MQVNERWLIIGLVLVGLLLTLPAVVQRYQAERGYRQYQIVLDYQGLQDLAAGEQRSLQELVPLFKVAGIGGLSVPVQTVSALLAAGEAYYFPNPLWSEIQVFNVPGFQRFSLSTGQLWLPTGLTVSPSLSVLQFNRTFVGPDPAALALVRENQLYPVWRIPFFNRANREEVAAAFADLPPSSQGLILFEGEAVLGYPHLSLVQEQVQASRFLFGQVEFSQQKGLADLAAASVNRLVRVHTITPEETDFISYQRALARWVRAVEERNVRLLYFQPFLPRSAATQQATVGPIDLNLQLLREVTAQLGAAGYSNTGPSQPLEIRLTPAAFGGVLLALLAAAYLTLALVLEPWWSSQRSLIAWLAGIALAVGLFLLFILGRQILASQITAFGIGLVVPVLAVLLAERNRQRLGLALLSAVGVTALGAWFVVAALAQSPFLLKTQQFLGVKLMHIVPPLVVAGVFWTRGYFRRWHWNGTTIALALLAAFGGVYLVLRTGNIAAVSDWERSLRDGLEALLVVRPRTKEFLLGHPALLLGLWLQRQGEQLLAAVMLVAGTVGLLSIINTFTHSHTPLVISLVRTGNGLWLGFLCGAIVVLVILGIQSLVVKGENQR